MEYKYYLWWDDFHHGPIPHSRNPGPSEMGKVVAEDKDKYVIQAIKSKSDGEEWIFYDKDVNLLDIKKSDEWLKKGTLKLFRDKKEMFMELL